MEGVFLKELVKSVNGRFIFGNPYEPIQAVSTDTRTLHHNDFFFALQGKNYDGHSFVNQAIELGARGIIISNLNLSLDKFFPALPAIVLVKDTLTALGDFAKYYRQKFSPIVIGITGSNGKTTTKEMLTSILKLSKPTLSNIASYNNFVGLPLTIFGLNSQYKYCIFELGISKPGEMERLVEISLPQIGILTNIAKTHLEFLYSEENVFNEKKILIERLPKEGIAVINFDDTYVSRYISQLNCHVLTYGINTSAQVRATDISSDLLKTRFKLLLPSNKSAMIEIPISGDYNVYNALAACSVAYAENIPLDIIEQGLRNFHPPEMRMSYLCLRSGAVIINDAYNANPSSMRQALLNFIKLFSNKIKITVLGDMRELGQKSRDEHRLLGTFLSSLPIDRIYLIGEEIKHTFEQLKEYSIKNVAYFTDINELFNELKGALNDEIALFFKASRAISLEKIIEKLQQL